MSFQSAVNRKAIDIGKLSVEMTTSAGSGHPLVVGTSGPQRPLTPACFWNSISSPGRTT